VGILGFLTRLTSDGVPEVLVQAKAEPGNVDFVQIGPTVQATPSNYTRRHGGKATPYLDFFVMHSRGTLLADSLQSEQGARFLRKRNRNMIVATAEAVPLLPRFRWISVSALRALLNYDNVVNMDARSVLSGFPYRWPCGEDDSPEDGATHRDLDIKRWLTDCRLGNDMTVASADLRDLRGWVREDYEIRDRRRIYFSVIGLRAAISGREVDSWCQPVLAPRHEGVIAFMINDTDRQVRVLVQAKREPGVRDGVEIAPTVQTTPALYRALRRERPQFLKELLSVAPSDVLWSATLSEEGGRFYRQQNRYMIVRANHLPAEEPAGFKWLSPKQLRGLATADNFVNVEARTLLSALYSLPCAGTPQS